MDAVLFLYTWIILFLYTWILLAYRTLVWHRGHLLVLYFFRRGGYSISLHVDYSIPLDVDAAYSIPLHVDYSVSLYVDSARVSYAGLAPRARRHEKVAAANWRDAS